MDDVTVEGSLEILVKIDNNGTFTVDDDDDKMYFGFSRADEFPQIELGGRGTFDVDEGELHFRRCKLLSSTGAPDMSVDLSAGLIRLADISITGQGTIDWTVDVSGGTLDLRRDFNTYGELSFSGGTIRLAEGNNAAFMPTEGS